MTDDDRLLQQYVREGSRAALEELARRNLDLVYSSALRQVRRADLAEDVTQAVFLVLARKAGSIRDGVAIGGWLLSVTRHAAMNLLRHRATRQRHEQMAAQITGRDENLQAWEELRPQLDEAMSRLGAKDRDAVVLRFFQNRSFAEIGAQLRVTDDTAQKRVSRALARLRRLLTRRGITLPAAAVAGAIGAHGVKAAPAHVLGTALAATSGVTAGTVSTSIAKGVITMIAWAKVKSAVMMCLAAILLSGGAFVIGDLAFKKANPIPESAAAPTATEPAAVTGIVVDAAGKPVADAAIEHFVPGNIVLRATTGRDGTFAIQSDSPIAHIGDYVATSKDGALMAFVQNMGSEEKQASKEIRLTLRPARSMAVQVNDEHGTPVESAIVAMFADAYPVARANSDAKGEATVRFPADAPLDSIVALKSNTGLDYNLFWHKEQVRNDPYRLDPETTREVALVLKGAHQLKVQVRDNKGQPLADVRVTPWLFGKEKKGDELNVSFDAFKRTTDQHGEAAFDFLPADNQYRFTFWVDKDGYAAEEDFMYDLRTGKGLLTAVLSKKVDVGGRVLDENGWPVAGANVHVGGSGYSMRYFQKNVTTAADGTYHLLVDPNMYYVFIAEKGRNVSDARNRVILTEADQPLNFRLFEGRRVRGRATAGPDNTPAAGNAVDLVYNDESYLRLSADAPHLLAKNNDAIDPSIVFSTRADKDGFYEFYAPPGKYQARSYFARDEVDVPFELEQQAEMQIDLHSKISADLSKERTGRVVRVDKPEEGVEEAVMMGHFVDSSIPRTAPEAVAGKDGKFKMPAVADDYYLGTISPDRKWADFRIVRSDEDPVIIKVSPAASASGRLVDDAGMPLAGRPIVWAHPQPEGKGQMISYGNVLGGRTKTDADGKFTVAGLLVGWNYEILLGKDDPNDWVSSERRLATITPQAAARRNLAMFGRRLRRRSAGGEFREQEGF